MGDPQRIWELALFLLASLCQCLRKKAQLSEGLHAVSATCSQIAIETLARHPHLPAYIVQAPAQ